MTREQFYQNRRVPKTRVFQWHDRSKRKVRRFMIPRSVAEAQAVMSRYSLKATTFAEVITNANARRPYWRVVQQYYGSVSHRSRRLVWDSRRNSGLAYTLNVVLQGRNRKDVVIAFGAGFRNRRSQHGEQHGPCPGTLIVQ